APRRRRGDGGRGRLDGRAGRRAARRRRVRLRPGVGTRRRPGGAADGAARTAAEGRHQPSRPGRARAGRMADVTKSRSALLSVGSNSGLILLKVVAGSVTGSVAILTEALHSAIDLVASIIAWLSVPNADEPPHH